MGIFRCIRSRFISYFHPMQTIIDFRSDTFTKPTKPMLEAMFAAPVGDDVFGEDPSVNALEAKAAGLFGMEAALFCSSGTMTNQIGIKAHTQPGQELICDQLSHVYIYEGGGIAFNSGVQVKAIAGDKGRLTADQVRQAINPNDVHKAQTSIVSLENTANRGGGSCYDFSTLTAIQQVCQQNNLRFHLDGARLWNALVAKGETTQQYGQLFDSISVCLSKGLGCPVGSLLLGKASYIQQARRIRKVFGGGMRQAGFLAAAGSYALDHHIQRLQKDHDHAQLITNALLQKDFIDDIMPVSTNIIICSFKGRHSAKSFATHLAAQNIKVIDISPTQVRFVLHLDISESMVQQTIDCIQKM
jgi:threonine aldolase